MPPTFFHLKGLFSNPQDNSSLSKIWFTWILSEQTRIASKISQSFLQFYYIITDN